VIEAAVCRVGGEGSQLSSLLNWLRPTTTSAPFERPSTIVPSHWGLGKCIGVGEGDDLAGGRLGSGVLQLEVVGIGARGGNGPQPQEGMS